MVKPGELRDIIRRPWPEWLTGMVIGILTTLFFFLNRDTWGISTGIARWGSWFLYRMGVAVEEWSFWQQEGWYHPLQDKEGWVNVGVIIGALLGATLAREFRLKKPRSWFGLLLGGYLMGYGARVAQGCNIGGFLSAVSSQSMSGWIFGLAMMAGVGVGSHLLLSRL